MGQVSTTPDQDRRHADLLLTRKRADQDLTKAKSDLEAAAKRLVHAYEFPTSLVVNDDGRLFNGRGDISSLTPPLPSDSEVVALVRRAVELQNQLKALDQQLKDFD